MHQKSSESPYLVWMWDKNMQVCKELMNKP